MSRTLWIALTVALLVLGTAVGVGALLVAGDSDDTISSPTVDGSTSVSRSFDLPLAESPSALALAEHRRDLLVGIAARSGGPIEIAALRAETPLAADALEIAVDGRQVEAESCGRGCSRVDASVLAGRPASLTVRAGRSAVSFDLPARLPPAGTRLFVRAQRTMNALRAFRFTEDLSSGRGQVVTELAVQAPNRLRLETNGGFRSVIIGRSRWDYQNGRWGERTPFPGLTVADVLMWFRVKNPRVVGRQGNVTRLAAFGLQPVPAWFRLDVEPSGRVREAEMLSPSHFMLHRYRDLNGPISIEPPVSR